MWYLARKARMGGPDALRWVEVLLIGVGALALIGIGVALSPLVSLAFCAIAFIFVTKQPFAVTFDAMARERGLVS